MPCIMDRWALRHPIRGKVGLGHSVERLAAEVSAVIPKARPNAARWSVLDAHYVTSRYPNCLPGSIPAHVYERDTAETALCLAKEVIEFAERTMSGEG